MKGLDVRWWNLFGYSAAFFFVGLLITELFGEIPPDIDFKPYFVPILLAVSVPVRYGWAVGFGAAVGEGFGDLIEGYEVDDPVGFVSYVLAFALAAYIVRERPENKWRLLWACLVAAAVNAIPEGAMFYWSADVSLSEAIRSVVGNIIAHGVVMGAIPVMLLAGAVARPLGRAMGFAELEWLRTANGIAVPRSTAARLVRDDIE